MALDDKFPLTRLRGFDNTAKASYQRSRIRSGRQLLRVNGGDDDVGLLRRNLADRTQLGLTGTPVVHDGYVRTTAQAHYLRSTVLEPTGSYTILVFGRISDSVQDGAWLGTYTNGADHGCVLWSPTPTSIRMQVSQGSASTNKFSTLSSLATPLQMTRYRAEVIRDGGGLGSVTIYDDTHGVAAASTALTDIANTNTLPFLVGSCYDPSIIGHCEWNDICLVEGIGTAQQIADHWSVVLAKAAAQGIHEGD